MNRVGLPVVEIISVMEKIHSSGTLYVLEPKLN